MFKVPFKIPEAHLPNALDWSRSNLETLYRIGKASAQTYLAGDGAPLLAP